ncbi:MAG: hypothetical protein R3C45_10185 [Phycisphaerales bacterium]
MKAAHLARCARHIGHDRNASGHQDTNESGLSGVTVYLDTNNNGRHDSGEPSAITGRGWCVSVCRYRQRSRSRRRRNWSTGVWSVSKTL